MRWFVKLLLVALGAGSIQGCKPRKDSSTKSASTDGSCRYDVPNATSSALLSVVDENLNLFLAGGTSAPQVDAKLSSETTRLSSRDPGLKNKLDQMAYDYAQAKIAERAMPIGIKAAAGYEMTQADFNFLAKLQVANPQRYLAYVKNSFQPSYNCLARFGVKADAQGKWDFTNSKISRPVIAANSCLSSALALFFGVNVAATDRLGSTEALVLGDTVISSCQEYTPRSRKDWESSVNRNLDLFKTELSAFLTASGAGSTYSAWMKGAYSDYSGTKPHEMSKDGSYNAMLKYRDMLKCLGVSRQLIISLNDVMSSALKIDARNIQGGIDKLDTAQKAAIAAPVIPLVIYGAPLVAGAATGSSFIAAGTASASATMALLPMAFGGGLAAINSTIDYVGHGGNWLCNFQEQFAVAGSGSMLTAPFLATIPVGPALLGGSATYLTASATVGTRVYGASNILVALGFTGAMGYNGVNEIKQCRVMLKRSFELSKAARNQNDVNEAQSLLTEASKLCAAGGVDIGFAISGGLKLVTESRATLKNIEEVVTAEAKAKLKAEELASVEATIKQQSENLKAFNDTKLYAPGNGENFSKLPEGLPADYVPGLEAIRALMRDKGKVFELIQKLELETLKLSKEKGIERVEALKEILSKYEAEGGFKPVIELENKSYSSKDWMDMLSEGALFLDVTFADKGRGGSRHGQDTHRVQWAAVMMYMKENPVKFIKTPVEYFKMMGNRDVHKNLNWDGTGRNGGDTTWSPFFDSFEKNFSSPEWFRDQHPLWPGLGQWF